MASAGSLNVTSPEKLFVVSADSNGKSKIGDDDNMMIRKVMDRR